MVFNNKSAYKTPVTEGEALSNKINEIKKTLLNAQIELKIRNEDKLQIGNEDASRVRENKTGDHL